MRWIKQWLVFCSNKILYAFANPSYFEYRKTFQKLVGQIPDGFHVDHVLSRNLAIYLGYKYVLLCIIPGSINMNHGRYEKIKIDLNKVVPDVCYCDERILSKVLSREPLSRQKKEDLLTGYDLLTPALYGLTLKKREIGAQPSACNI